MFTKVFLAKKLTRKKFSQNIFRKNFYFKFWMNLFFFNLFFFPFLCRSYRNPNIDPMFTIFYIGFIYVLYRIYPVCRNKFHVLPWVYGLHTCKSNPYCMSWVQVCHCQRFLEQPTFSKLAEFCFISCQTDLDIQSITNDGNPQVWVRKTATLC
jgi:hypothetical protein